MTFEDVLNLSNGDLNEQTAMMVMDWEPLTMGYFGSVSETPRQKELEEWLETMNVYTIGDYYINVKDCFCKNKDSWNPAEDFRDAWEVFQKMRKGLFSKRQQFMNHLKLIVKEEVGADVAWPDAFWFLTPDKICRAALSVYYSNQ